MNHTVSKLPPAPVIGQPIYLPEYGYGTIVTIPSYGTVTIETVFRQLVTVSGLGWNVENNDQESKK